MIHIFVMESLRTEYEMSRGNSQVLDWTMKDRKKSEGIRSESNECRHVLKRIRRPSWNKCQSSLYSISCLLWSLHKMILHPSVNFFHDTLAYASDRANSESSLIRYMLVYVSSSFACHVVTYQQIGNRKKRLVLPWLALVWKVTDMWEMLDQ